MYHSDVCREHSGIVRKDIGAPCRTLSPQGYLFTDNLSIFILMYIPRFQPVYPTLHNLEAIHSRDIFPPMRQSGSKLWCFKGPEELAIRHMLCSHDHYPPPSPVAHHITLPEFESCLVLRVNEREYGIPELVSFLSDNALEKGFSSDQTFPSAGSSDFRHMCEGALYQ